MSRNPELARLLAALNGTAQASNNGSVHATASASGPRNLGLEPTVQNNTALPETGFLLEAEQRSQTTTPRPHTDPSQDPRRKIPAKSTHIDLSTQHADHPRTHTPVPPRVHTPAIPDASTITTYPAALKHITKHLAPNEAFSTRIKHLVNEQHKHERQWSGQREAILNQHANRGHNQTKAAALLKSLGGFVAPSASATEDDAKLTPAEETARARELAEFDKKVYKNMIAMVRDYDAQLRKMGVPFYCIKHELVITEEGKAKDDGKGGRLDKGELRKLQRRVVELLEDLFGD